MGFQIRFILVFSKIIWSTFCNISIQDNIRRMVMEADFYQLSWFVEVLSLTWVYECLTWMRVGSLYMLPMHVLLELWGGRKSAFKQHFDWYLTCAHRPWLGNSSMVDKWEMISHGGRPFPTVGVLRCLATRHPWNDSSPLEMASNPEEWFPTVGNAFPPWENISP